MLEKVWLENKAEKPGAGQTARIYMYHNMKKQQKKEEKRLNGKFKNSFTTHIFIGKNIIK